MDTGELTNLHPLVAETLERWQVVHKVFDCDPQFADTAVFCEKYDYPLVQAANAIIVAAKSDPVRFACCMVLAVTKLDVNKKVRSLMDGKKVSFASGEQTVALSGMQIGGVTPFGLPEIPLYIDSAVMTQAELWPVAVTAPPRYFSIRLNCSSCLVLRLWKAWPCRAEWRLLFASHLLS